MQKICKETHQKRRRQKRDMKAKQESPIKPNKSVRKEKHWREKKKLLAITWLQLVLSLLRENIKKSIILHIAMNGHSMSYLFERWMNTGILMFTLYCLRKTLCWINRWNDKHAIYRCKEAEMQDFTAEMPNEAVRKKQWGCYCYCLTQGSTDQIQQKWEFKLWGY